MPDGEEMRDHMREGVEANAEPAPTHIRIDPLWYPLTRGDFVDTLLLLGANLERTGELRMGTAVSKTAIELRAQWRKT